MKKRENNLELLRIISMLMVVTLHLLNFGGLLWKYTTPSGNAALIWLMESLCYVAVNCYVLISGYFLVKSQFKIEKLIKLILEVVFYSVFIYLIMVVFKQIEFSFWGLCKSFLPVFFGKYWFVTCYIVLYILFPYLNKLIYSLSKKEYQKLILLLTLMFSLWAVIVPNSQTINYGGGYSISWFICLYLFAGYIRLHFDIKNLRKDGISLVI